MGAEGVAPVELVELLAMLPGTSFNVESAVSIAEMVLRVVLDSAQEWLGYEFGWFGSERSLGSSEVE